MRPAFLSFSNFPFHFVVIIFSYPQVSVGHFSQVENALQSMDQPGWRPRKNYIICDKEASNGIIMLTYMQQFWTLSQINSNYLHSS